MSPAQFTASDGTWWSCGRNDDGQLAQGHTGPFSVAAPRRLGFEFEPWAFATGGENCVLLTKDGTLWTWRERLGVISQPGVLDKLKDQWNRFIVGLLKRGYYSGPQQHPKIDSVPYKLWELPADMRRSLAGNTLDEKQAATDAAHLKQ